MRNETSAGLLSLEEAFASTVLGLQGNQHLYAHKLPLQQQCHDDFPDRHEKLASVAGSDIDRCLQISAQSFFNWVAPSLQHNRRVSPAGSALLAMVKLVLPCGRCVFVHLVEHLFEQLLMMTGFTRMYSFVLLRVTRFGIPRLYQCY